TPTEQSSSTDITTPRIDTHADHPRAEWLAPERAKGLLSIRPTPMVGREDIRRQLLDACENVVTSEETPHRLVMLVGPAGVGKSRIVEWLTSTVHEEGRMVPLTVRYRRIRG